MIDRNSQTWLTIKSTILNRIEHLRTELEQPHMPPEGTRGEITALRWLLNQGEPDAPITEPTGTDYMMVREPQQS